MWPAHRKPPSEPFTIVSSTRILMPTLRRADVRRKHFQPAREIFRSSCKVITARHTRSLVIAAALVLPMGVEGQSLLERPPNLSGEWTGAPGTLYFHFIHRFSTSGAPQRKVSNVPTFLLGAG